ncbi:methylase involved in ubiquinone/menaquinone biosynthesis [Opitutaceae bacterium TAV1]|nr:methylase involved in ubiquinone/menaquinone biosynthesis [Opitutaceae bacterium TAV1]
MSAATAPAVSFDERAATWDADPRRHALTEDIAREIIRTVPLSPHHDVLDYGCGTGALAFQLLPRVREIVAADSSPGMIAEVRRKLALAARPRPGTPPRAPLRLHPLVLDLTRTPPLPRRFHLVIASLVLHHVPNPASLLASFARMLAPDGWLVIVEWSDAIDPDDLLARPNLRPASRGFTPDALASLAAKAIEPAAVAWRTLHHFPRDDGTLSAAFLLRAHRLPPTVCPAIACGSGPSGTGT